MHRSLALVAATFSYAITVSALTEVPPVPPPVTAAPGSLPLGAPCSSSWQCAVGASCYGVNSGIIPRCGNFESTCLNDTQCAFNTCIDGFCKGFIPASSSSTTATPLSSGTAIPSSSDTIPVGGTCPIGTPYCADGSSCYAVNSFLIPVCGNFQASCSKNSQCAFNTCNQGLCNGPLAPSLYSTAIATSTATSVIASEPSTPAVVHTTSISTSIMPSALGTLTYAHTTAASVLSSLPASSRPLATSAGTITISPTSPTYTTSPSPIMAAANTFEIGLYHMFVPLLVIFLW